MLDKIWDGCYSNGYKRWSVTDRSGCQEVLCKIGALENCAKFERKHMH